MHYCEIAGCPTVLTGDVVVLRNGYRMSVCEDHAYSIQRVIGHAVQRVEFEQRTFKDDDPIMIEE